ncbi:MAG: hypothetical protein K0Q54_5291 [Methylobacterium brachiatum]|nr:hypothetical protein [Methylobacterium brachiatum]
MPAGMSEKARTKSGASARILGMSALVKAATRAWRIKKDWLRTGQRVRLLDVMAGRTLDQLLFGNREGTVLANAIRHEALKPFRVWGKRRP